MRGNDVGAANVIDEYDDLDFSMLGGLSSSIDQITQIHEDSPFLNEIFKGESWKKVKANIPNEPIIPNLDKEDDTE